MAECTDREFVVVKCLAQMEMTPEEVAEMMDITGSELIVDHELDEIQSAQAIAWCKSEQNRHRAERTSHPLGTPEYDNHDELGLAIKESLEPLLPIGHESEYEDDGDMLDYGHTKSGSNEGKMSKSRLYQIARDSSALHDMLEDGDDLPEWSQEYIALAAAAVTKVYNYLDYKLKRHGR